MSKPLKTYEITNSLFESMSKYIQPIKDKLKQFNGKFPDIVVFPNSKALNNLKANIVNEIENYSLNNFITSENLINDIISYICVEVRLDDYILLSHIGKRLLIAKIIEKLKSENIHSNNENYLTKIINVSKFAEEISIFLSNLKIAHYKLLPFEEFNIDKLSEILLKQIYENDTYQLEKYKDIVQIINIYEEEKTSKKLLDDQDLLIRTIHYLNNNSRVELNLFKDVENIYLFGIKDFSLMNIEFFNALANNLDSNLFISIFKHSTENIIEYLDKLGFEQLPEYKSENYLNIISDKLFKSESILKESNNYYIKDKIGLVESNDIEEEVHSIAKLIKYLLNTNDKLKQEDILILSNQLNMYEPYFKRIFSELNIDTHIHNGESLINNKLIYTLLNILELKLHNFRYSDFIRLIKSNYVFIKEESKYTRNFVSKIERFFAERKVSEYNFVNQIKFYIDRKSKDTKYQNDLLLNDLKEAMKYIYSIKSIFEDGKSDMERNKKFPQINKKVDFYELSSAFKNIIEEELSILRNVFTSKERREKKGEYYSTEDIEISRRDSIIFGKFIDILEELGFYYNLFDEKLTLWEFYNALKQELEKSLIIEDTDYRNKVQIYDIDDTTLMSFKYVFVVGMIENGFPKKYPIDIFIKEYEKTLINNKAKSDIFLTKKLFYKKEENIFCNLFDLQFDKIYFSYTKESEGKNTLKSFFIDELIEILKQTSSFKIENIKEKIPSQIYCEREFIEKIIPYYLDYSLLSINQDDKNYYSKIRDVLNNLESFVKSSIKIDEKYLSRISEIILSESLRNNDYIYTHFDGNILYSQSENISGNSSINGYLKKVSDSMSPTSFETFGICPMRFFFNKVIGIREPSDSDALLSPSLKGTTIHKILEIFYKEYVSKILEKVSDKNFTEIFSELKSKLIEIIEKEFNLLYEDNKIINYDLFKLSMLDKIKLKICEFFERDFNFLIKEKYKPKEFEYRFGMAENTSDALKITDENGALLTEVKGSIDRIDIPIADFEKKARVIDYKSEYKRKTVQEIIRLINEGKMFQPTLYALKVLEDENLDYDKINWTFHYLFDMPKTKFIELPLTKDSQEIKTTIKYIKNYKHKILKGMFYLAPRECPNYCRFCDVCRYVEYKTENKAKNVGYWEN